MMSEEVHDRHRTMSTKIVATEIVLLGSIDNKVGLAMTASTTPAKIHVEREVEVAGRKAWRFSAESIFFFYFLCDLRRAS